MSASGPENRFILSIHKLLKKHQGTPYAMKNHNQYNGGIADCWYSGNRADLWVEYKFLELPKRPGTVVDFCDLSKPYCLSKLQQEWVQARFKEGRKVGVIIGTPTGGVWLPGLEWRTAMTAADLRLKLLPKPEIAQTILALTMRQHG